MAAAPATLDDTRGTDMTDQDDYDAACFALERCLESALADCKTLEGLKGQQARRRIQMIQRQLSRAGDHLSRLEAML
jgi:hypothetical protein